MDDLKLAKEIAQAIAEKGGESYFVGGYVRDLIIGKNSKDIDIEVYGIEAHEFEKILANFGEVLITGKQFAVFKIAHSGLDIALPRKEKKIGDKHQDFEIITNPFLDKKEAARRRDFTINAFMQNVLTGEVLDFYGGLQDLKNQTIRHIDDQTFIEDPLRVLRAARFASQLDYTIAEETIALCQTMDLKNLSKERIHEELIRALMTQRPSKFFNELKRMDQLKDYFKEIEALIGIEQNPCHHLEDAYDHTMMVIDAAVHYRDKIEHPTYFMMAALVHDLGKINAPYHEGHYGWMHEILGLEKIEEFLARLTNEKELLNYCKEICANHMRPHGLYRQKAKSEAILELLDSVKYYKDLLYVGICDDQSRITKEGVDSSGYIKWVEDALTLYHDFLKRDLIKGDDLMALGYKEGIGFKDALMRARKLEYLHTKEKVLQIMKEDLKCASSNK